MQGSFFSLYKPLGISSFKAISEFKKKNNLKKIGHMGTLDPLAEGVLPVATGEATKLIQYADLLPKVYECEIYFGENSPTLDREPFLQEDGSLRALEKIDQVFLKEDLLQVLRGFKGTFLQKPPVFSAVHIDGKRAYDLARKVEDSRELKDKIKAREVECFRLELLSLDWPLAKINLEVGKGFYVRSLVRDLAEKLRVPAFMYSLKRLKVGVFEFCDSDFCELKWEEVLKNYKQIEITEAEYEELKNGKSILNRFSLDSEVSLAHIRGDLLSLLHLEKESNMLRPKNNFSRTL